MGGTSGSARDKYMMKMLEKAFPKCVDGEAIAIAAGTLIEATPPDTKIAVVLPKEKPVTDRKGLDKKIQVASIADDPVPAEETNFEKLMAGSGDISAPDTKVLEAKIAETAVDPTDKPDVAAEPAPAKLPFEVKKEVKAPAPKKVVASVEPSWNIQIGAYPKKEAARLKLKEILASRYKFLSGKQAITVEVKKGAKTVYRARFSGFTQKTAKAACAQLSKKGLTCLAFSPQS
jgi:D-alanyl-D-alanine carboxypeptidase